MKKQIEDVEQLLHNLKRKLENEQQQFQTSFLQQQHDAKCLFMFGAVGLFYYFYTHFSHYFVTYA